ncbi:MAG: hypothetical protein GC192_09390 [Bacteroidetes bacterium]|nr:hypothetical protein [Bacteroidota bacterium]
MKYALIVLFSLFVYGQSNCQTSTVPEWYLNYLFERQCGTVPTSIGLPLMWSSEYSRDFLLKKLNSNKRRDKLIAIQYLGMSKDTSLLDYFKTFLSSQDQDIASYALRAIYSNNSPQSIQILENILVARHGDRHETLEIARRLENTCKPSSIPIINNIRVALT